MKCGTFAFWTTFEMTWSHVLSLLTFRHTHTHDKHIYILNIRTTITIAVTITKNQISVDSAIISQDPGCHLWGRKWITVKDAMFFFKCFQSQTGTKLHFDPFCQSPCSPPHWTMFKAQPIHVTCQDFAQLQAIWSWLINGLRADGQLVLQVKTMTMNMWKLYTATKGTDMWIYCIWSWYIMYMNQSVFNVDSLGVYIYIYIYTLHTFMRRCSFIYLNIVILSISSLTELN